MTLMTEMPVMKLRLVKTMITWCANSLSEPLRNIYNNMPLLALSSVADLYSAFSIRFSRLLYYIEHLSNAVGIRTNQFWGMKGASTQHFLIELWQQAMVNLEDNRAASVLIFIDYSKAVNRLNFDHCLKCLAEKGASNQLLANIGSFLSGMTLIAKVRNSRLDPRWSTPRLHFGSFSLQFLHWRLRKSVRWR